MTNVACCQQHQTVHLRSDGDTTKNAEPCVLVIFGATGDLTSRKLLPALFNLSYDGLLPAHFACVAFARREKSDDDFRAIAKEAVVNFSRNKPDASLDFETFSEKLFYHQANFTDDEGYEALKTRLEEIDQKLGTKGNRIYYLSTQPSFFPLIVKKLKRHKLLYDPKETKAFSRVIIEKPFGHDLASALTLQKELSSEVDESQIYRIDHYLGKETVQNLLVFRFANPIFEELWNHSHIDHIQITVSEEIGIGTRGRFFEEAGILRDIVQNHMMQLLSLTLMEPPITMTADAIRDEKVKVLKSIQPMTPEQIDQCVVRGQYKNGVVGAEPVIGYREEENVDPASLVETYVAMKLFVNTWRFANIPIYLRAGKRLSRRLTEIAIQFKRAPQSNLFGKQEFIPNVLVMQIQPNEGISLKMNCKVPGLSQTVQPVKMDFKYGSFFGAKPPEAYERLINDCMAGDTTLFARIDEVIASWNVMSPILDRWEELKTDPVVYAAGSQGPTQANQLLAEKHRSWRLI